MFITLSLSDTFILSRYINFFNKTPKLHVITTFVIVDLQTEFLNVVYWSDYDLSVCHIALA
jgi:hypothetical protein